MNLGFEPKRSSARRDGDRLRLGVGDSTAQFFEIGLELQEQEGSLGVYALGMDISLTSLAKALITQSADLTLLRLESRVWKEKLQFSVDVNAASDFDLLWLSPQRPQLLVVTANELIRYAQGEQYQELERMDLQERMSSKQGQGSASDVIVLWGEKEVFLLDLDNR